MSHKKSNPVPQGNAGRARKLISVAAITSEDTKRPLDLQQLRAQILARRFGLSRSMAFVLADIAFQTREGVR